jgi:predicted nucleic acid-binding protein
MSVGRFLVDASAIARYPDPAVAAQLDALAMAGLAVSCGLVELQLQGALPDAETYTKVAVVRAAAFEVLETSEVDLRRAAQVQALLVERGEFGVTWPALVIAAVAERHEASLLHSDTQYDVITKATGQAGQWVGVAGQAGA